MIKTTPAIIPITYLIKFSPSKLFNFNVLLISGLRAFSISIFFIAARIQVVSGALRALRNVPCNYKENWYNAHLQIRISKDSENKFRRWIPKTFGWRKKGFPWGTARKRDFILLMFPGNISYIFT